MCWSIRSQPAFVITLAGQDQRVPTVIALFKKYANLNLRPFYGINGNLMYGSDEGYRLTPGERGLRESFTNLLQMAIRDNYNEMFVFEDDAIPHLNFTQLFKELPRECRKADVLVLGAMLTYKNKKEWPKGTCFKPDPRTYGTFAVLYRRSAFQPILNWLMETNIGPLDSVYRHLLYEGINVRVAYPPFLAIMDVSHRSSVSKNRGIDRISVEERADLHEWNLDEYPMSKIVV
ncbi:unnamed protein product [Adineta steineri]|uniref:Glycosyl transferase family 25 domain-containing protein n=1 Tax=Adineta steineri TaxID=433720 RepID=A0A818T839_9BILA|nr:unnamed protein product [Adineta steineri]CAF3681283.1 unnamed protein product [Adineta steineri]